MVDIYFLPIRVSGTSMFTATATATDGTFIRAMMLRQRCSFEHQRRHSATDATNQRLSEMETGMELGTVGKSDLC